MVAVVADQAIGGGHTTAAVARPIARSVSFNGIMTGDDRPERCGESPMNEATGNKHADRSARTRERFIVAAQELFANCGVEAVSLNEITVAAGQKNRNALQYHFGSREGLLQAIIDLHAGRVNALRTQFIASETTRSADAAEAAARSLVMPLAQYIEQDHAGVHYVKILSQVGALNSKTLSTQSPAGLTFHIEQTLRSYMNRALAHLPDHEARQRRFLTVLITFHGLADSCRAAESVQAPGYRWELFEQVALAVESLLRAPALQPA
jgi:AcrR family transcriptional regulator